MRALTQSPFCYSLQTPPWPHSLILFNLATPLSVKFSAAPMKFCLSKPQSLSGAKIGNLSPKIDQSILWPFNVLSN